MYAGRMKIIRKNWLRATVGGAAFMLIATACGDAPQDAPPTVTETVQQQVESSEPTQQAQPTEPEQDTQTTEVVDAPQQQAEQPAQEETSPSEQQAEIQQQQQEQESALAGITPITTFLPRDASETPEGIPIIRDSQTPQYFGFDWSTDWSIRIIDLEELSQGAARDAIPAINSPLYWTIEEAAVLYTDNVPLVQVRVGDDVRGFPLEILTWHEIVNDTIGGKPVTVTFCPLCNTAIAFESQIGEETFVFGVSGLLRNSDLVMYDRNTESLWQQSSGRAIVGTMVGARLTYVPASVVTLGQLRSAYPDALVMSRDTGWNRAYGQNPYQGYDNPEYGGPYSFFFDRDSIDPRLPPAERVVSIEGPSGAAVAYPWSALTQRGTLHDSFDGVELVVFWAPGALSILDSGNLAQAREVGTTAVFETTLDGVGMLTFAPNPDDPDGQTFVDAETGSIWDIFGRAIAGELTGSELTRIIHSDHFWFAWQAFHPDTEVVDESTIAEAG